MENINEIMSELAAYIRMLEDVQNMVDDLKDKLKKHMDENGLEVLAGSEHKATYKACTTSRIDTTALKKAAPDIAERFTKTSTVKRFTFK